MYTPATANNDDEKKYQISKPVATEVQDCQQCSDAEDASLDKDRCIEIYADVCNMKLLKRCYNTCLAEDGTKNLTPCEKMKCLMYCAKAWSDDCHGALSRTCRTMTSPPPIKPDSPDDLFDPNDYLIDCDVNCDSASGLSLATLLPVVMMVISSVQP
jgi:hypothetical protein